MQVQQEHCTGVTVRTFLNRLHVGHKCIEKLLKADWSGPRYSEVCGQNVGGHATLTSEGCGRAGFHPNQDHWSKDSDTQDCAGCYSHSKGPSSGEKASQLGLGGPV